MPTDPSVLSLLAPGAQVVVRDEEWLIRAVQQTRSDGVMVKVIGTSELVRDQEATFFTELDDVQPLRPEDTRLVTDPTPSFRRSRLYLEALLRKTPLPVGETRLAVGHRQLLDELDYQRHPVKKALEALRPRLLIADAVGLGKTLEVGMLLSELIRRGRGDRILVVTPRHILEQFQREMWTRFAIPLVRLDSEGIQRVRQKIPATRNPFTFYKRVIISIDTLKNAGRYRHHLEGIRWDAVVIDECHSLVNHGTLNNQLARVLAPRTDALILTSATPHNGKPESFAELVRMLDPTAITDPRNYTRDQIEHLHVRRHKGSSEVAAEVGSAWADRLPPKLVPATATPVEDAVFDELANVWMHPEDRPSPVSGDGNRLFPYTLLKAFLSSHVALAETIEARRKRLAAQGPFEEGSDRQVEDDALDRLHRLVAEIDDDDSSKLTRLVDELKAIGIGRRSATRAVVFSERHATLHWLAAVVPERLGLKPSQVRVLHGGLPDVRQQSIVEEFALAESDVRLLFAGDIASEGVNLHRQCHHLVHFDLPWSLITIEQRNGRIDRYGQAHNPEIRAMVLVPRNDDVRGDIEVLSRLLDKEHHAHKVFGDASSIMGKHSATDEEREIMSALAEGRPIDEVVPDEPAYEFDFMMVVAGVADEAAPVETITPLSLFPSDAEFVEEALREAFDDPERALEMRREPEHALVSFVPPDDLRRRLEVLPQSYLTEQRVTERLRITYDPAVAEHSLRQARESSDSLWPSVVYLSSQHPVVEWLTDKVLVRLGRNEAPVLLAAVDEPTFLVQGVYSNRRGQPTVVEWMAIDGLPDRPSVHPLEQAARDAGLGPDMPNPGHDVDVGPLRGLLPAAVEAARAHMRDVRDERGRTVAERVRTYARRLRQWQADMDAAIAALPAGGARTSRQKEKDAVVADMQALIGSLGTAGDPLVRVIGVLVPREARR